MINAIVTIAGKEYSMEFENYQDIDEFISDMWYYEGELIDIVIEK